MKKWHEFLEDSETEVLEGTVLTRKHYDTINGKSYDLIQVVTEGNLIVQNPDGETLKYEGEGVWSIVEGTVK